MACEGCFDKQIKIDKLEKRIVHLEYKLRRQEIKSRAGYFGSSTPSSRIPIKENSKKSSDKEYYRKAALIKQKRLKNQTIEDWLKNALDKIVINPNINPYSLLPAFD